MVIDDANTDFSFTNPWTKVGDLTATPTGAWNEAAFYGYVGESMTIRPALFSHYSLDANLRNAYANDDRSGFC